MARLRKLGDWEQEVCLPIVKDVILQLCREKNDWVLLDEIVGSLLLDRHILESVAEARARRNVNEREIVANMVAWFSQKFTQYQNGDLSKNYRLFNLMEEAYITLDRKETEQAYAYKLRPATTSKILPKTGRTGLGKKIGTQQLENLRKQEEFNRYVEELKKQNISPEEFRRRLDDPEEFRKRKDEWGKR